MLPPPVLDHTLVAPKRLAWWKKEDTHLFVLSFGAFFIAFSSFIA
jgi:hypothetical protein